MQDPNSDPVPGQPPIGPSSFPDPEEPCPPVQPSPAAPVEGGQRIETLDLLRGFALLGILIMNIQSFSMITAAYQNPTAYGDFTGVHRLAWMFGHLFADQKFLSIFSILFGAGVLLMTRRAEERTGSSLGIHFRRMGWLALIGMLHAYLLWYGDILFSYALCAMVVFLLRKISPRWQLGVGLFALLVPLVLSIGFGLLMTILPEAAMADAVEQWKPSAEIVAKEVEAYRGGWLEQMEQRLPAALILQIFVLGVYTSGRAGGLMLIGMALFQWGILSGTASRRIYRRMLLFGFGLGFPLVAVGVWQNWRVDWDQGFSMFFGTQFNYLGSLGVSTGYIALVMLTARRLPCMITDSLCAVGRMAFTNYLMQTVICTTIFYGHGFGLYGKVERLEQLGWVLLVWAFQIPFSVLWLKRYRFGPAEWLWRSLTYRRLQPMRRETAV